MNKSKNNEFCYFKCNLQNMEYNFNRYKINYIVSIFRFKKDTTKQNIEKYIRNSDICIKLSSTDYLILFFSVAPESAILPIFALEKKILKYYHISPGELYNCVLCSRNKTSSLRECIDFCSRKINNSYCFVQDNIFEKE